jgi:hypothetical protein
MIHVIDHHLAVARGRCLNPMFADLLGWDLLVGEFG